jgi:hypothetical protein
MTDKNQLIKGSPMWFLDLTEQEIFFEIFVTIGFCLDQKLDLIPLQLSLTHVIIKTLEIGYR